MRRVIVFRRRRRRRRCSSVEESSFSDSSLSSVPLLRPGNIWNISNAKLKPLAIVIITTHYNLKEFEI